MGLFGSLIDLADNIVDKTVDIVTLGEYSSKKRKAKCKRCGTLYKINDIWQCPTCGKNTKAKELL